MQSNLKARVREQKLALAVFTASPRSDVYRLGVCLTPEFGEGKEGGTGDSPRSMMCGVKVEVARALGCW